MNTEEQSSTERFTGTMQVQEKLKFYATQGAYKGKNAVQITDLINPPQRFTDLLDQVRLQDFQS